jgi:hypothetical protein
MIGACIAGTATTQRMFTDKNQQRQYVDIDLAVALPTGPQRTMRVRRALLPQQQARLTEGAVVVVRAHPKRPMVAIDLAE